MRYILFLIVSLLSFSYALGDLFDVPLQNSPVTIDVDKVIVTLKNNQNTISVFSSDPLLQSISMSSFAPNVGTVDTIDGDYVSLIATLKNNPLVASVEPNYIYHTFSFPTPSDSFFWYQWWLNNQWQALSNQWSTTWVAGADIWWLSGMALFSGVDNPTITGTVVAVIDNGVLYTHEDLQSRMRNGTNCVSQNNVALGNCIYGYDFYNNDTNPIPSGTDWHGTHVSWILWASLNSSGVVWVNPHARIMALRAWISNSLDTMSVVNSIWFAQYNGAKVINASFGWTGNSVALSNAIAAYSWLFIAAAWNSAYNHASTPVYPCDYWFSHVICVGAFTQKDEYASFSDYGSMSVDVAAPGEYIASTFNSGWSSAYAYSDGTSMATPFVAGIASLLRSYYPQATRDQVKQAILSWVVEKPYLSSRVATSGRVNLYNSFLEMQSIMLAASLTPSAFTFDAITGAYPNTLYTSNIVTLTWFTTWLDVSVTNWLYSINGGLWSWVGTTGTAYSGDTLQLAFTSSIALSLTDYMIVHVWDYYTWFYVTTTDPLPGPAFTATYPSWYYYNTTWFTINIEVTGNNISYEIFGDGFTQTFSGLLQSGVNSIPVQLSGTVWWNHVWILVGTSPYVTYDGSTFVLYDNENPYLVAYITSGMTITWTTFTFSGSVYDNLALKHLIISGSTNASCDFNASDLTWCNFTHTIIFPGSGTHYLTFDVEDKAWNIFPVTDPLPIVVDLTDRMPDAFTFAAVTSAVRSTAYSPTSVTVVWIETWVTVWVSAGEYRINWGSWVSSTGTIYSWDTLEIRLTSSASYSTPVSTIVTVWYYTTTFSITTTSAPSSGWWWGWGGGWWSSCSLSSAPHWTINSSLCTIVRDAWYILSGSQCIVSASSDTGAVDDWTWLVQEIEENYIPLLQNNTLSSSSLVVPASNTCASSSELQLAYQYAYGIQVTTMPTLAQARLCDGVNRAELAKMMANYAINVVWLEPDKTRTCSFYDTSDQSTEMKYYIRLVCQLWIMGVGVSSFDPYGSVDRGQFWTVLSRILYADTYNGWNPYYVKHLNALKNDGIITNTDPSLIELRGYVMLMLRRAVNQ